MEFRVRLQLEEAFGSLNRWFCSEAYGRPIDDPELLLEYYIKSGGAKDFADRFEEATGTLNRWYCSEFYRQDIRDPETLWDYYINYAPVRSKAGCLETTGSSIEFDLAC
jgi:hypothetical protein